MAAAFSIQGSEVSSRGPQAGEPMAPWETVLTPPCPCYHSQAARRVPPCPHSPVRRRSLPFLEPPIHPAHCNCRAAPPVPATAAPLRPWQCHAQLPGALTLGPHHTPAACCLGTAFLCITNPWLLPVPTPPPPHPGALPGPPLPTAQVSQHAPRTCGAQSMPAVRGADEESAGDSTLDLLQSLQHVVHVFVSQAARRVSRSSPGLWEALDNLCVSDRSALLSMSQPLRHSGLG